MTTMVPPLEIGADDEQVVSLTVPAGVPVGPYVVLACADRRNAVVELNDRNNCSASSGAVSVSGPDLIVEAMSERPGDGAAGAPAHEAG
jgi:subtilase family serine protease